MSRPRDIYLTARYVMRPKPYAKTFKAGWASDPANVQYDEQIGVVTGLKPRDLQSGVVLNLSKAAVIQNSMNNDRDFDSIFGYFLSNYTEYMTKAMTIANPEFLQDYIKRNTPQEEQAAIESEVGAPPPEGEPAAS
jgi:hypothetical protein